MAILRAWAARPETETEKECIHRERVEAIMRLGSKKAAAEFLGIDPDTLIPYPYPNPPKKPQGKKG